VRYLVGDLGGEIVRDAGEVGRGLAQAIRDVACGRTSPLPVQAFALEEANAAFRFMANARHTGKIVLLPKRTPVVRRDGIYLVTGGLGGLGLATARWLAGRGAGQIVLTARSEPSAEQLAEVAALGDSPVRIVRCDVSDRAALEAMVNGIMVADLPLRGVFHAAGVLDDATLDRQDQDRYAKVAGAKSDAAWWLSELTSGAQLDFFVLFSSSSSVFGSPGQANYSASNAFLDGLAAWRRAHGKVGTSIAWGAWDEVGMAAKLDERIRARWAHVGVGLLPPRQAISAMESVLAADLGQAAILAVDTARFVESASPYVAGLFANLVGGKSNSAAGGSQDDADLASDDPARRQMAMTAFVRREIARVLGFSAASLDENVPLHELGLDSLMAVQFRNAVSARLGLDVPLKRLLQGVTAAELTVELSREEFVL
jgi:NAD(P)-dependent dehydrogenase (short-subunit alcohol dehydrogenase family)